MDIVEWLRGFRASSADSNINAAVVNGKLDEAADEIERLREEVMAWWKEAELMRSDLAVYSSEIERLRDELQRIADVSERWEDSLVSQINEMAHKALKEKE